MDWGNLGDSRWDSENSRLEVYWSTWDNSNAEVSERWFRRRGIFEFATCLIQKLNFFTIKFITTFTIRISWSITNSPHPPYYSLAFNHGDGDL
ncbi:hypothetical protein O181_013741 [Austropuccinia psidii MF-1]|uniref:Uncharacterized protein n=1 Tax=Austropuccinia psidii MF-1 TaxID=1389203 RepID=A0A9Q3GNI1_9BASI|nr:hypothetical protein [Austropuccinia psidii MF-1]